MDRIIHKLGRIFIWIYMVRVRILFQDLIGGVVLVGRWVVVVTPTAVLKNENLKKVFNCCSGTKKLKIEKVKNFLVIIPWI